MKAAQCSIGYMNRIFENVLEVDQAQVQDLYHDVVSAGVIIPSGEGRSKGALSIACSEMAKMRKGKIVLDRSEIGFPGRDMAEAAPILRQRFGQVCLLVNSGSGKSLMPLIDAQKLAFYIAKTGSEKDFRIDVVTSNQDSPIGRLGSRYGNVLVLKGREVEEEPEEARAFRTHGILEDVFILGSGILFHCIADAISHEEPASKVLSRAEALSNEIAKLIDEVVASDFFNFLIDNLEQRHSCFFAGLGSSQEVARMTATRVVHVKGAIGDHVYVAGESNTPSPRAGDMLIVISHSGETEVVASWCKSFKKKGGLVASIVGTPKSTVESLSDATFTVRSSAEPGRPNDFYIKAAFVLSPLPIYLVERVEQRGLRLPEYVIKWYHSVTS